MKQKKATHLKSAAYVLSGFLLTGMVACGGTDQMTEAEATETTVVTDDMGTDMGATAQTWNNESFNADFTSNNNFSMWDENRDGNLDNQEFTKSFYTSMDRNKDNKVDENEWNMANQEWSFGTGSWQDWDTNSDNVLDYNEFETPFGGNSWFGEWDKDGDSFVSDREYTDGVFGRWDKNRDGILDNNEYQGYRTYYGM